MSLNEKLKKISSGNQSNWLQDAGRKLAHAETIKNGRKLALHVLHVLQERGLSQSELARKMGVSRQQVTKIVKGDENFTLETIEKLEKALDLTLVTFISPKEWPATPGGTNEDASIEQGLQEIIDTDTAIAKEGKVALRAAISAVRKEQWVEAIQLLMPWLGTATARTPVRKRTPTRAKPDDPPASKPIKRLKGSSL